MCVRLSVNQSAMLTPILYALRFSLLYYRPLVLKLFSIATQIGSLALCMSETEHLKTLPTFPVKLQAHDIRPP